jgi:hypothetical protein
MRIIISLFLILIAIAGQGQAMRVEQRGDLLKGTETMWTFSAIIISEQAESWHRKTKEEPGYAPGWFNYYLWTERDKGIDSIKKSSLLTGIVSDAGKHIRQSSEYSLMLYLKSGRKDSVSLFKALDLATDKFEVYPYIVQYGIIRQNTSILATYTQLLEKERPLSSILYTYHYNALMSADSNTTIYGRGLHDIVPMGILQNVHNIRKDINLQYYTGKVKNPSQSYLCLSLGEDVLSQYPNAAYTGLLVKMTDPGIDELKKHYEKDMDLSFLEAGGNWSHYESRLFRNYLPSFILLYRHYRDNNNSGSERLLSYINKIASRVYELEKVKQLLRK